MRMELAVLKGVSSLKIFWVWGCHYVNSLIFFFCFRDFVSQSWGRWKKMITGDDVQILRIVCAFFRDFKVLWSCFREIKNIWVSQDFYVFLSYVGWFFFKKRNWVCGCQVVLLNLYRVWRFMVSLCRYFLILPKNFLEQKYLAFHLCS
jgi:hypothetical protein